MNYYQENQAAFLEGLKTFLRIPSISTLSEHKPDIRRAAEFVLNELRAAGLTGELIEGEGNPLVFAEWTGAPGKPTLLMYGHYDVQPPDPLDEWKSPPFEPEGRAGSASNPPEPFIIRRKCRDEWSWTLPASTGQSPSSPTPAPLGAMPLAMPGI